MERKGSLHSNITYQPTALSPMLGMVLPLVHPVTHVYHGITRPTKCQLTRLKRIKAVRNQCDPLADSQPWWEIDWDWVTSHQTHYRSYRGRYYTFVDERPFTVAKTVKKLFTPSWWGGLAAVPKKPTLGLVSAPSALRWEWANEALRNFCVGRSDYNMWTVLWRNTVKHYFFAAS